MKAYVNRASHALRFVRSKMIVIVFVLTALAGSVFLSSPVSADTVFITGTSRGIGLELTRQYAQAGWDVVATCRNPGTAEALQALADGNPNITIEELDVLDHDEIDALAAKYKDTPIDILINNAGINGGVLTQMLGKFDYDMFDLIMATNVKGPLKLTEAFTDHVAASDIKKIITITSSEGSIANVQRPAFFFYRASKAAINMIMATLTPDLARRDIIIGLINPGVVATDMSKGAPIPMLTPEESVRGLINVIDSYTLATSGTFLQWDGQELPW